MDRNDFARDLEAWLDGELEPDSAAAMQAFAAADPEAARMAESERAFGARVKAALLADVGPEAETVVADLLAKARAGSPPASRPPGGRLLVLTRVAASVAAALLIAFSLGWFYCVGPFECSLLQAVESASDAGAMEPGLPAGFPALPHPPGAEPCAGPDLVSLKYAIPGRTVRACYTLAGKDLSLVWCEVGSQRPSFRRHVEDGGEDWWIADEHGRQMVAFVDGPTGLLCCIVGDQPTERLLEVGRSIRTRAP